MTLSFTKSLRPVLGALGLSAILLTGTASAKPVQPPPPPDAQFFFGDFSAGDTLTSSAGQTYDFTGPASWEALNPGQPLPFSFTTTPLAFQWGFYLYDNPPDGQSPANVASLIETWTGLTIDPASADPNNPQVEQGDISGGFTTKLLAEIVAIHIGQGELLFIFENPVLFTLADYTKCSGQSCPNGISGLGLSNFRSYNYTDNNDPGGNTSPVPIPGALPLLATGLAGLGYLGRRRKNKTKA